MRKAPSLEGKVRLSLFTYKLEVTMGHWASLVARIVENLPVMQETQVQSLGQEDPLEKRIANHSSLLAWKIPWTEKPGGLQSIRSQRVGHF